MAHPWLNAQDALTLFVPVAGSPYRREGWICASGDNLDLGEETIEDVHSARCDEEGNENDTVLSHPMVEKDANSHDSGGTCCYLYSWS